MFPADKIDDVCKGIVKYNQRRVGENFAQDSMDLKFQDFDSLFAKINILCDVLD